METKNHKKIIIVLIIYKYYRIKNEYVSLRSETNKETTLIRYIKYKNI